MVFRHPGLQTSVYWGAAAVPKRRVWLARRDEGANREFVTEEQRSPGGMSCPGLGEGVVNRADTAVVLLALAVVAWGAEPAIAAEADTPTYTKDVLPILQRSCQQCHRPGTAAPMALLTYEQVRPWARAIKDRVTTRQMPPWHLDRSIGVYRDDPSLSDEEIAVIAGWVDTGAQQGNPEDAPPPLDLVGLDEWVYGEPDLIVSMKQGFTIPAEGADFFPSEVVDSGLTEDRYMKWVQVITIATCCVHHEHVYATTQAENPDDDDDVDTLHVTEYVMGNNGDYFPDGTGKLLKAGSRFRFAPHYHPWGEDVHGHLNGRHRVLPARCGAGPRGHVTSDPDWDRRRLDVEPREGRRPAPAPGR